MPTQGKKENIQIAWGLSPVSSHCEPLAGCSRKERKKGGANIYGVSNVPGAL